MTHLVKPINKRFSSFAIAAFAAIFALSAPATVAQQVSGHTPAPSPTVPSSVNFCGKTIDLDRQDMFERYDRELMSLIYGHTNTLLMLKRANKYFPIMAPILKENGIPEEFLYLACIESVLSNRALSPAKAAGIWQFMPSTGTQYGLEVGDEVDERYNLEKATAAACKYFKTAYNKYGDWPTVMASYNAGMGRISSELSKQLQNSSFDLYLTEETSRYVFRIMAMQQIFKDPAKYGFRLREDQFYQPVACDIVEVSEPVSDWAAWAKNKGITYAQLREENPWIRSNKLTNKTRKTYKVRVPKKDSLKRSTGNKTVYDPKWVSK